MPLYAPKHAPKNAHYTPRHAAPREPRPVRNRVVGAAVAGSASLVTVVAVSTPADAAGSTVWDRVAACESGGNWAINTGNSFFGGLQFTASTWRSFGGTRFAPRADLASKAAQITTAKRVLVVQGPRAWPVCSRQAGLNRGNGTAVSTSPVANTVSRSRTRAPIKAAQRRVAKLAVDGVMGHRTIVATQRWVGTSADGIFGPRSVMALQRKVGSKPDGVVGPRTIRAMQAKVGARRDGASRLNAATVSALQKYLSSH